MIMMLFMSLCFVDGITTWTCDIVCVPASSLEVWLHVVDDCRTLDKRSKAVYHTNVMLCVGTDVAIVCADGVKDDKERQRLLSSLGSHQTVRALPDLAHSEH